MNKVKQKINQQKAVILKHYNEFLSEIIEGIPSDVTLREFAISGKEEFIILNKLEQLELENKKNDILDLTEFEFYELCRIESKKPIIRSFDKFKDQLIMNILGQISHNSIEKQYSEDYNQTEIYLTIALKINRYNEEQMEKLIWEIDSYLGR